MKEEKTLSHILQLLRDPEFEKSLKSKWAEEEDKSSAYRWKQLKNSLDGLKKPGYSARTLRDIVFNYTYPRLDVEVSKGLNHLLKSPFCIHPSTGFVCVPIRPETCEDFDPTDAPNLRALIDELNESEDNRPHHSRFNEYLTLFTTFQRKLNFRLQKDALASQADSEMSF